VIKWERKEIRVKRTCLQVRISLIVIFMLLLFAGCDMDSQELSSERLPPLPEECKKFSNSYTRALHGVYQMEQVSQFQLGRVAAQFSECMQDEGLTEQEAEAIIKDTTERFKEKLKEEEIDSAEDFFVF
jgi:hypothetical protein